ncbi:L-rhamnose mutarotase [Hymenobacter sp. BT186]|uniref:L-rhamnose mutarotase n=1 Tax=Hymenobacter telluris TaxID=2816474 RepID=A0A939EXT3_9BACT|nr:L-rhamnose mutarotase [Hymenobacter telluris]MBO0359131.1 L-rhamnose mutarotase [Hymenobacter telluris]MBW3375157.1 L-rhamnose mutarotase [Hymenobacter norwichensis]
MEEIAFTMQLKPGNLAEYERRHNEIWPELTEALQAAGIYDYSIYVDSASGTLFAVQKRTPGHTADELPTLPIMQKWWAYMADLMETNPDNSPVVKPLERLFYQA